MKKTILGLSLAISLFASDKVWQDTQNNVTKQVNIYEAKQYCKSKNMIVPPLYTLKVLYNQKENLKYYKKVGYLADNGMVVNFKDGSVYDSGGYRYNIRCFSSKQLLILYKKVKQINTISGYQNFINKYPQTKQVKAAWENIYKLAYQKVIQSNTVKDYQNFIDKYPRAKQTKKAQQTIYKIAYNDVKSQNNISGYEWFISKYPNAPQVKDAIKNIHKLAYNKAKEINTISAYNTFVYAYPYASQVQEANNKAYKLESSKYNNMKKDDERKARLLAVKIKKLTILMDDMSNKSGYTLVKNRMVQLLTEQYEETDASLRYYESKEFTDFTRVFKNTMNDIKNVLNKINGNTKNISKYAKKMIEVSQEGFSNAKADRAMSRYKNEEHTKWEKRMHLREKGYN